MFTIAKFILPDARRVPRADSNGQDEEGKGLLAVGRTLVSQWYDGNNDDWQRQFASNDRISPKNENQPYLTYLADLTEDHHLENEIESFMLGSNQASDIWERHVERVQSLILGDSSGPTNTTRPSIPTIWVWDSNCSDRQFSTEEFFQFLKKKRLPETHGRTNSPLTPRRIYINNPGGDVIQELIRQLPVSQTEGFRELLAKYVHNNPRPYFGLRECTRWNQAFSFLFNCPYYAITSEDAKDHREISKGKGKRSAAMRSRESLDFLYPSYYRKGNRRINDLEPEGEARYIQDVVSSGLITGHNDDYWNCYFFNEDLCLEPQKQRLQAEAELDEDGGTTDPITMTEETAASLKPRVYGLQALVCQFDTILGHQLSIAECFGDSFVYFTKDVVRDPDSNIGSTEILEWGRPFRSILTLVIDRNSSLLRSFHNFLFVKDVCLGHDGTPNGRLFQSLKRDPIAMKALHELVELYQGLEDVNRDLERQRRAYDDFRRERKDDQVEEDNRRFVQGQKLQQLIKAIATLQIVLTLLGLAVQLFDAWNPSYLVPFVIVVIFITMISIAALVYFCWKGPVIRLYMRLRHQDASRLEVDEEAGGIGDERNKPKRS